MTRLGRVHHDDPVTVTLELERPIYEFLIAFSKDNSFFDDPEETITTAIRGLASDLDPDYVKHIAEDHREFLGVSGIKWPKIPRNSGFDEDFPF